MFHNIILNLINPGLSNSPPSKNKLFCLKVVSIIHLCPSLVEMHNRLQICVIHPIILSLAHKELISFDP